MLLNFIFIWDFPIMFFIHILDRLSSNIRNNICVIEAIFNSFLLNKRPSFLNHINSVSNTWYGNSICLDVSIQFKKEDTNFTEKIIVTLCYDKEAKMHVLVITRSRDMKSCVTSPNCYYKKCYYREL